MRDDRLFLEVPVASRYVVRILEHRLESTGIPPYQLGLLTHIRHAQPVTPTEISTASGVPLTTLRDDIQRLVDGGLARRIPHPTDPTHTGRRNANIPDWTKGSCVGCRRTF